MNLPQALAILELKQISSFEDIKTAFRKQATRFHPDKNPTETAEENFRKVVEAYEFCVAHQEKLTFRTLESVTVQNLDDIFEDIFGFSKSGRILGLQDPEPLFLTLDELALGGIKILKLKAYVACDSCAGSGSASGMARICRYCFGQGFVRKEGEQKKCYRCEGRGREIQNTCQICDGFGRVFVRHRQKLHLPVGLCPHKSYTLQGLDLVKNQPTQIFVKIHASPHSFFQIENYDLLCEYFLAETKKGQVLYLQTPLGRQKLVVPLDVKPGTILTVPQGGLYKDAARGARGELKVRIFFKSQGFWARFLGGIFGKRS